MAMALRGARAGRMTPAELMAQVVECRTAEQPGIRDATNDGPSLAEDTYYL